MAINFIRFVETVKLKQEKRVVSVTLRPLIADCTGERCIPMEVIAMTGEQKQRIPCGFGSDTKCRGYFLCSAVHKVPCHSLHPMLQKDRVQ